MVAAVAILILALGIYILIKGEVALSKTSVIRGGKARIIGTLIMACVPLTAATVFCIILVYGDTKDAPDWSMLIPAFTFFTPPLVGVILGFIWAERKNPRRSTKSKHLL